MRLTLRTLLAYLDDVLDPNDKEQLAQKIESSDFAKDLVHQTRDSVRRLRLSAPQVIGTGMAMDPNTVAEYLDNALPPEQVGDYERIFGGLTVIVIILALILGLAVAREHDVGLVQRPLFVGARWIRKVRGRVERERHVLDPGHAGAEPHAYGSPLAGFGIVRSQLPLSTSRSVSSRYGLPAGKQRAVGSRSTRSMSAWLLPL